MSLSISHGRPVIEPPRAVALRSQAELLLELALDHELPISLRARFATLGFVVLSEARAGSVAPARDAELKQAVAETAIEELGWPGLL